MQKMNGFMVEILRKKTMNWNYVIQEWISAFPSSCTMSRKKISTNSQRASVSRASQNNWQSIEEHFSDFYL